MTIFTNDFKRFLFLCIVVGLFACPIKAQENHLLGIGMGALGIVRKDNTILYGSVEYRAPKTIFKLNLWVSIEFANRLFYGAGGLLKDFHLTDHLVLTPSLGICYYSEDRNFYLGHPIEFRSSLEIAYQFEHTGRLGISFGHISNSSLGDKNPGSEMIKITYCVPLRK